MKTRGIIRKIDRLGRIVIPKGYRNALNIACLSNLEIFVEEDTIILTKGAACVFCGEHCNLEKVNNKYVCKNCIEQIRNSK